MRNKFIERIEKTENCWFWRGGHDNEGYGVFSFKGKNYRAHRISYKLFKGPLNRKLQIDHLCRKHGCVNPEHLAAKNAAKTNCYRGHPFTPENMHKRKDGRRICRRCAILYKRKWRKSK